MLIILNNENDELDSSFEWNWMRFLFNLAISLNEDKRVNIIFFN